MEKFEIWLGYYSIDGYTSTKPKLVATIEGLDFKSVCMKHTLKSMLDSIELQEKQGYVNSQSYEWFYNPKTMGTGWIGKYYPSREEALKSFPNNVL